MATPQHALDGISPQSIVSASQRTSTTTERPAVESSTQDQRKRADRVWLRLAEIYGHRLTSAFGDKPPQPWIAGIAKLTDQQIRTALGRCVADKIAWPPTLPEFIALCEPRPEDHNLPSLEDAYREAVMLAGDRLAGKPINPSHPAIWHAADAAGLTLLTQYAEAGKRDFARCWQITVRAVMAGEQLAPIPKALPPPEGTPDVLTDQERAERDAARDKALAQLDQMFGKRKEPEPEQSADESVLTGKTVDLPHPSRARAFADGAQP